MMDLKTLRFGLLFLASAFLLFMRLGFFFGFLPLWLLAASSFPTFPKYNIPHLNKPLETLVCLDNSVQRHLQ